MSLLDFAIVRSSRMGQPFDPLSVLRDHPRLAGVLRPESLDARTAALFAVIHLLPEGHQHTASSRRGGTDDGGALVNARRALSGGAAGVFLIDMHAPRGGELGEDSLVVRAARSVRGALPHCFIGVNLLGQTPTKRAGVVEFLFADLDLDVDALWIDDGADAAGMSPVAAQLRREIDETAADRRRRLLLFGGFSFKGSKEVPTAALQYCAGTAAAASRSDTGVAAVEEGFKTIWEGCSASRELFDVVMTSGRSTGVPMDSYRAVAVRAALGHSAVLGLGSGVDAENIERYLLSGIDVLLVGTSLERPLDLSLPADRAWARDYLSPSEMMLASGNGAALSRRGDIDEARVAAVAEKIAAFRRVAGAGLLPVVAGNDGESRALLQFMLSGKKRGTFVDLGGAAEEAVRSPDLESERAILQEPGTSEWESAVFACACREFAEETCAQLAPERTLEKDERPRIVDDLRAAFDSGGRVGLECATPIIAAARSWYTFVHDQARRGQAQIVTVGRSYFLVVVIVPPAFLRETTTLDEVNSALAEVSRSVSSSYPDQKPPTERELRMVDFRQLVEPEKHGLVLFPRMQGAVASGLERVLQLLLRNQ
jgi:hypothetical protein